MSKRWPPPDVVYWWRDDDTVDTVSERFPDIKFVSLETEGHDRVLFKGWRNDPKKADE